MASRSSDELLVALDIAGVPAEAVRQLQYFEVFDDEENIRTGVVASYYQHDWGQMHQFGAYWDFGDLGLRLDRACPTIGEHTRTVLADLGFDGEDIDRLARAGVVVGPDLSTAG